MSDTVECVSCNTEKPENMIENQVEPMSGEAFPVCHECSGRDLFQFKNDFEIDHEYSDPSYDSTIVKIDEKGKVEMGDVTEKTVSIRRSHRSQDYVRIRGDGISADIPVDNFEVYVRRSGEVDHIAMKNRDQDSRFTIHRGMISSGFLNVDQDNDWIFEGIVKAVLENSNIGFSIKEW